MSGPYRRQIALWNGKLKKTLDELEDYRPQVDENLLPADNEDTLLRMKSSVEHDTKKIHREVELIQTPHDAWIVYIQSLEGQRHDDEARTYEDYFPQDGASFLDTIGEATDALHVLHSTSTEIRKLLVGLQQSPRTPTPRRSPTPILQVATPPPNNFRPATPQPNVPAQQPVILPPPPLQASAVLQQLGAQPLAAPQPQFQAPFQPPPPIMAPIFNWPQPQPLQQNIAPQPAIQTVIQAQYQTLLCQARQRKFAGDILKFMSFDQNFDICVHNTDLPDMLKFQLLLEWLDGDALKCIAGLPVTAENYSIARNLLKRRFGNPAIIRNALHSKVKNMRAANDTTRDLRQTMEIIEMILRQLEQAGDDCTHYQIALLVESKFPSLLNSIYKWKTENPEWSVSALRDFINDRILQREIIDRLALDSKPYEARRPSGQHNKTPLLRGSHHSQQRNLIPSSTFAVAQTDIRTNHSKTPRRPCTICGGSHFVSECTQCPNGDSKLKFALNNNTCFVCFQQGHRSQDCRWKSCKSCDVELPHNRVICSEFNDFLKRKQQRRTTNQPQSQPNPPRRADNRPADQNQRRKKKNPERNIQSVNMAVNSSSNNTRMRSEEAPANNLTTFTAFSFDREEPLVELAEPFPRRTLLLTVEVLIRNPNDSQKCLPIVVFLDNGSENSYISKPLAESLELPVLDQVDISLFTFTAIKPQTLPCDVVEFEIELENGSTMKFAASTLQNLTPPIDNVHVDYDDLPRLLTEPDSGLQYRSVQPTLLLGANYYWQLVKSCHKLPCGYFFIDTVFGPALSGNSSDTTPDQYDTNLSCPVILSDGHDTPEEEVVDQFWNLESIGIFDSPKDHDDEAALQKFLKSIQHIDGRYRVRLPWKEGHRSLPTNFGLSLGRLRSDWKKMMGNSDPNFIAKYDAIFKEQKELGIIEKVTSRKTPNPVHYLAHHPVQHPQKPGKIRQVYDGSARTKNEPSLNECLHRGPVYLADLAGLWLRFRTYENVLIADIVKAFLNIEIVEEDRDVLRFIWLKNIRIPPEMDNLQIYRFERVPFGLVCSPFLLAATLRVHLTNIGTPLALTLLKNLYVDNMLIEVKDPLDAKKKYEEVNSYFGSAGMKCQEFASNLTEANEFFESKGSPVPETLRVLGMNWSTKQDTISFQLPNVLTNGRPTKRHILKFIARIFDPTGMLCPVTVKGKIFFQSLWRQDNHYGWDDELNDPDHQEWRNLIQSWNSTLFCFVRLTLPLHHDIDAELHICVDASAHAYAACAYIRLPKERRASLIFSKNRLRPVNKEISIPRLELMAVVIGIRLADFVGCELQCNIISKTLWSDSQCVLHWILRDHSSHKRFVKNRLEEIKISKGFEFRYIPTSENPADLATRGLTIEEFSEFPKKTLWFKGPKFWELDKSEWPKNVDLPRNADGKESEQPIYQVSVATFSKKETPVQQKSDEPPLFSACGIDSWIKLFNTVCFVLRYCTRLLGRKQQPRTLDRYKVTTVGKFSAEDHLVAERVLILQLQKEFPPGDDTIRKNDLFIDQDGIWRCFGRLEKAELSEDAIFPIYLPLESPITRLIVLFYHIKTLHGGIPLTLAAIRDRFWIPSGRRTVKRILRRCMLCKRFNAKPYRLPDFPCLPAERVRRSPVFAYAGLDYIGPLLVKVQGKSEKLWIVLLTCLSTRAIHLEYVLELTSMCFINAMRRFVARRGRPRVIYSDNATTFVLAEKSIKLAWQTIFHDDETISYFAREQIVWRFITPSAPWQGGHYERLVANVKNAIRRSIRRNELTLEAFATLLPEVESVVNSRPLTYLYDSENYRVLRPSDFLHPNTEAGFSPIEENHNDEEYLPRLMSRDALLKTWKKTTKCLDKFWNLWTQDYLKSLRERYQYTHKSARTENPNIPTVGEVVLLEEELPRGFWKLARIVELPEGSDGQIRNAVIELANKTRLQRPISALYPLELTEENQKAPEMQTNFVFHKPRCRVYWRPQLLLSLVMTLFWMFASLNASHFSNTCPHNEALVRIHSQPCTGKGIAVMRDAKNNLCWTTINCPNGHIRPVSADKNASYCGPRCACFDWTDECSHYNGSMTAYSNSKNETVMEMILKDFPPSICSLELSNTSCDPTPLFGRFNQIMLFDNTTHLVSSLHLQVFDGFEEDIVCIGKPNSTQVAGTSRYCEKHSCTLTGLKFCYYPEGELVTHSAIPLKAWGQTSVTYYGFLHTTPTRCESCSILCVKGGVSIRLDKSIQRIEVCAKGLTLVCYLINSPDPRLSIHFPAEVLLEPYDTFLRGWIDGIEVVSQKRSCDAQPFCEMISCSFCWIRVANPQCIPRETLLVILFLFYIAAISLYYISKAIHLLTPVLREPALVVLGFLRLLWNQVQKMIRFLRLQIHPPLANRNPGRFRFIPARIRRVRDLIAVIALANLTNVTRACSEVTPMTATHEVCHLGAEGSLSCTFSQTTLLSLLPKGQEVCLLLQDEAKHPLGTFSLRVMEITTRCRRETLYHTRSYKIETHSSKRCPYSGSCVDSRCTDVELHDTSIPELGEANKEPGHTYCFTIGEGWKFPGTCDGCFICHQPACLFFRTYAIPVSETVFEVFRCPLWETEVHVLTSLQMNGHIDEQTLILHPGQTTAYNHLRMTLASASLPPAPSLDAYFVSDGNRISILHGASPSGHPTPGLVGSLQCPSKEKAQSFRCNFPPNLCSCHPGYSTPHCTCSEMVIEPLFANMESTLPVEHQGLVLQQNDEGEVEALFGVSSVVQIQLVLEGLRAVTKIESSTCTINKVQVSGCYRCFTGAKIHVTCHTNFGTTLATIRCANHNFVVPCHEKEISSTVTVNFDDAILDEDCTTICPGGTTPLYLKGTLAFVETPSHSSYRAIKVFNNAQNDEGPFGALPNLDPMAILKFLSSRWTHLLFIAIVFTLVVLTIMFLPILLQLIFPMPSSFRSLRFFNRRRMSRDE